MQILRLLAARRDDEGPFFDLDFSSCSVRASSSSSSGSLSLSLSDSDSDDDRTELDFIISLQRSRSASPLFFFGAAPLKFCASEPPARASSLQPQQHNARKRGIGNLRTMSFGARKAAPLYGGRPSFARSSSGRHSVARGSNGRSSFARSSSSSARSLRLFLDSPPRATEDELENAARQSKRAPSRDVFRRCLAKISRRLRTSSASPRAAAAAAVEARGLHRLRKCWSASSEAPRPSSATARRDDDSAVEKQDCIAGAIAHCKESLHRASVSECDSPLLRSRSDPGNCEVA